MHENKDTISREAAKNALCQLCRDISNWRMCERNDECNLICRIDGVPATDVRPVVFCLDCDMYECHEYDGGLKYVCRLFKRQMQETDFCSYGEKREGS